MAISKKKETVEPPTKRERAIVKRPEREIERFRGFDTIFDDFRRSFDDLMAPFLPMRTYLPRTFGIPIRAPLVDFIDEGNQYVIKTELPGFNKDDVNIEVNKDLLVFKAEKKSEEEEKSENYLHRERFYASCERIVNFPEEVDPSKVEGTMENGVLQLKIPKKEPKPEEKMMKVQIK
ncbi:MAG: Hsp20/alpha crystallin family protein [Methanotrichaceae archaeon]|nr:Hsp20/alpha crystallin family protein [Methanotrichaceae archaeon]